MKGSAVRPLAGLGLVVALVVDLRARRRPVPRQLHRNRAGDRHLGPRRPGDEPRRQGEDARCAGGQGQVNRGAGRRDSGAAPGHGPDANAPHSVQRPRRHHVAHGLRRQVRSARAAAGSVAAEIARGPGDSEPARHRRDQHRVPAARRRCWTRSTPRSSTRRSARSRRPSTAAARRSARRWSTSTRCWPRSSRACRICRTTSRRPCRRSTPTPTRRRISSRRSRTRRR